MVKSVERNLVAEFSRVIKLASEIDNDLAIDQDRRTGDVRFNEDDSTSIQGSYGHIGGVEFKVSKEEKDGSLSFTTYTSFDGDMNGHLRVEQEHWKPGMQYSKRIVVEFNSAEIGTLLREISLKFHRNFPNRHTKSYVKNPDGSYMEVDVL